MEREIRSVDFKNNVADLLLSPDPVLIEQCFLKFREIVYSLMIINMFSKYI